jgi:carboxylesterase type B
MKNFSAGYVKKLGLSSTGEELAKDLRAVKAHDLIKAAPKGASFGPIVDGHFIKDPFFCMIESGDYYKVPIIAGGNRNEYTLWMLLSGGPTRKWKRLWKVTSSKKRRKTVDQILNAEEKENYALASAMCGKLWQAGKVHRAARAMRKYQKDVYVYEFQWGGTKGTDIEFVFGAAHANEIAYFNYEPTFDIWAKNLSITKDNKAAREALAKAMRTYYAQFLHSGNPNGKAKIPEWKSWSNEKDGVKTLNLDASSEPGSSELKVFMTKREYVSKELLQEIENMTHETAKEYSLKIAKGWTKSLPCGE